MADSSDLPPYPGHGKITHAQRDGAELARIRIRQNERQLRSRTRTAVPTLPPLVVSNRVSLETHRTEEIDRSRHEEKATHLAIHGKQRVTRNTAALLKKDREEDADSPPGERWESRVLRHMFPASTASADSTDDGNDSDFEEGKNKFPRDGTPDESDSSESAFTVKSSGETADEIRVDGRDGEEEAEALSSGDDYVDQSSDENEEEDSSNNDQSESEEHHRISKALWESYAEKRTVKDPMLTKDVEVLHRAGANVKGILRYLRERTESEHKANLRNVVEIFKTNNADWHKIRVIMTDKAVHEKDVLYQMFPQATQLLCQWHVVTWLKKQAARLAKLVSKEVKALMSLLVYATSDQEYEDAKGAMLEKIGEAGDYQGDAQADNQVNQEDLNDIPVGKSIPQMNKVMEAIETIKIVDDIDLFAYWPDYGYARLTN
ncbi:hypothetical protein JG687_00013201 [Phytophthora cactorum]|uniref:ZSWIM1/3 RNaseH-like domain-containing protein n=3 Tax=Phytophthora cactorum TaxID=29920 RepID=A0A8T1U252_9STRA|nr:hypothetical protein JG687_00013201 [Phytophthora cactorum]